MFWRALSTFLILPGTVGFLVPWWLRPRHVAFGMIGLPALTIGIVLLLWCVRDFYCRRWWQLGTVVATRAVDRLQALHPRWPLSLPK